MPSSIDPFVLTPSVDRRASVTLGYDARLPNTNSRDGDEDRLARGDDDGVLVVRGEAAVRRADRPPVALQDAAPMPRGEDRLDGDDQSVRKAAAAAGVR